MSAWWSLNNHSQQEHKLSIAVNLWISLRLIELTSRQGTDSQCGVLVMSKLKGSA